MAVPDKCESHQVKTALNGTKIALMTSVAFVATLLFCQAAHLQERKSALSFRVPASVNTFGSEQKGSRNDADVFAVVGIRLPVAAASTALALANPSRLTQLAVASME